MEVGELSVGVFAVLAHLWAFQNASYDAVASEGFKDLLFLDVLLEEFCINSNAGFRLLA